MTATERLRRMLDERGVEWWNETDPEPQNVTMARAGGQLIAYHENANGSIGYHVCNTHDLTPEQAVAATLGRRVCHKLPASGEKTCIVRHNSTHLMMEFGYWRCSECGCECFEGARHCMNCGAKVVDEC